MRCTNKIPQILSLFLAFILVILTACGKEAEIDLEYELYDSSVRYGMLPGLDDANGPFYAQDKVVATSDKTGDGKYKESAKAYACFDDSSREIRQAEGLFDRIYPASTTKIMTAYIALKYGDLKEVYTVSENAVSSTAGTSVAGLMVGDKVALSDLLYGLLLSSGNDAAVVIAEGMSGTVSDFAGRMNEEAAKLGASHTHFVNPHGLHDDAHYTCAYDMYLIFHEALKTPGFTKIIKKAQKKVSYQHGDGSKVKVTYSTTNKYLDGTAKMPKGVKVLGGKTGTTNAAGYCLIVYAREKKTKHTLIGMVFDAQSRDALYTVMTGVLSDK